MTDPLAEVLRSVRMTGGVFLDARFTAPWGVHTRLEPDGIVSGFIRDPGQIIAYHVVLDGHLTLSVDDASTEVSSGEIVLLPRNDLHRMVSGPGIETVAAAALVQPGPDGGLQGISYGGGGAGTHLVCGFLAGAELHNPLIAGLPKLLKLNVREAASRDWVEASVRFAASELAAGKLASSAVMSRLSELLFVEAVREYAAGLGSHESGWLLGLADPQIGRALAAMHQDITKAWSTEALAREAAMSRSGFVERFTALVGLPPIRYLTQWRLQTAKLNLRETQKNIAQLAHAVGYESEEAFSRAFKREFGLSPARWREEQAAA